MPIYLFFYFHVLSLAEIFAKVLIYIRFQFMCWIYFKYMKRVWSRNRSHSCEDIDEWFSSSFTCDVCNFFPQKKPSKLIRFSPRGEATHFIFPQLCGPKPIFSFFLRNLISGISMLRENISLDLYVQIDSILSTVVCILVGMKPFSRFWRNHP